MPFQSEARERYVERRLAEYERRRGAISPARRELLADYWRTSHDKRIARSRPTRVRPLPPGTTRRRPSPSPLVQAFQEIERAIWPPDPVAVGLGLVVAAVAIIAPWWVAIPVACLAVVAIAVVTVVREVLARTIPAGDQQERALRWWVDGDLPPASAAPDPAWAADHALDSMEIAGSITAWREQFLRGEITAEELDAAIDRAALEPERLRVARERCAAEGHDYDENNACRRCRSSLTLIMGDRTETRVPPHASPEEVEKIIENHRRHALKIGGLRPAHKCDGAHVVVMGDPEQRCRICKLTPDDPNW